MFSEKYQKKIDTLFDLKDLFSNQKEWVRTGLATDDEGRSVHILNKKATCFSFTGALWHLCYPDKEHYSELIKSLSTELKDRRGLAWFQRSRKTEKEDIIKLIDKVIYLYDQKKRFDEFILSMAKEKGSLHIRDLLIAKEAFYSTEIEHPEREFSCLRRK